jgi:dynein assembly factor 5
LKKTATHFKLMYPEFLKRLDDSQDNIRISMARLFVKFFKVVDDWQSRMAPWTSENPDACTIASDESENGFIEIRLDDVHWEAMVKGLAIHMDDTNSSLQVLNLFSNLWPMLTYKIGIVL